MTRALIAVGSALALLIGGLGLAVFLTRDKDNLTVDNALSEDFTRDVSTGSSVDLRELAPFRWQKALVVAPGTPRSAISDHLGYEWKGTRTLDTAAPMVILLDGEGQVARFFDYRGRGRFEGFRTPIADVPRDRAVFRVRGLVVTPAS